jgi:hypothetical protein
LLFERVNHAGDDGSKAEKDCIKPALERRTIFSSPCYNGFFMRLTLTGAGDR